MWRYALLAPLLVAGSHASPQPEKNNSTSTAVLSSGSTSQRSALNAQFAPSSIVITLSGSNDASSSVSSTRSLSSSSSFSSGSPSSSSISRISSSTLTLSPPLTTATRPSSSRSSLSLMRLSRSFNKDNNTRLIIPSSTGSNTANATGPCTGCVIQAYNPITTFFNEEDIYNPWTSVVVTETVITSFITYNDTVVTERKTVNQTKAVVITNDQTITHNTPFFRIQPTPGVYLTVNAGPTYVIYRNLYGGLDRPSASKIAASACGASPTQLKNWQPTRHEDWNYFVQTYTQKLPIANSTNIPVPLPSGILQYLKNNLAIQSQFHGSNIATCTLRPTQETHKTEPATTLVPHPSPPLPAIPPPERTSAAAYPGTSKPPANTPVFTEPFMSITTGTFLSTTYASTSTHVTRAGCLRCQDTVPLPIPTPHTPEMSDKNIIDPEPTPNNPNVLQPSDKPNDPSKPENSPKPNDQHPPGVPVVIGDSTYNVNPVKPTPNPERPGEQNQVPPVIVIGSQTLTQGQSTIINGVPVVVPSEGGGSRIVVGGTTVNVNYGPTGAPVLTVGSNTLTANPQGQFVVGTQTLKPGGPAITVDGSTLSLGPSGTIAIVNGVTQTLANAPIVTGAPAITVGGRVVTATVIGGTTQFVLGNKTLLPGNAIAVDGTTYSMPSSGQGSTIVINGVTSILSPGQSALTLGKQGITANVKDGTTAFIFGPGQTLTPGGVLTISGTTFSMPASASGFVIVINGVTSTLAKGPITAAAALTIDGKTYTASVRDGTMEYVLGPGVTLRPGEVVTMSGTTFSLDGAGTALVINGKTSTIPNMPASNSASTTATPSSSSTKARDVGNFVWSGIGGGGGGGSSSTGGGTPLHSGGLDKWVESLIIGAAGWLLLL